MHEPGVSAEDQLRHVKNDIALLHHYLSEAEKGHEVPFDELSERMEKYRRALQSLCDGRVDSQRDLTAYGAGPPSLLQNSAPHTRVVGKQVVSNLQRHKAQQLLDELTHVESSLQHLRRKMEQRNRHLSEKDHLLGSLRRSELNDDLSALHHIEQERVSLQYTRTRMRQLIDESSSVMKALQDQGRGLEEANSKVADILESLGISNSTALQILRRNRVDAWIVYGGIALTLLLMYLIW